MTSIKIDNNNEINKLIKNIYEDIKINYIEYKEKYYYECSNIWSEGKEHLPENIKNSHNDIECDSSDIDFDNCKVKNKINVDMDKIKYKFNYTKNGKVNEILKEENYENITLEFKKDITMINLGTSDDHRGSDHCLLNLEKKDKVKLNKIISLYDFITACYNLKSHKFDKWYELYCRCKIKEKENEIEINLQFDYGS